VAITFSNVQAEPKRAGNEVRVLVVEDSFMIISALDLAFDTFGWTIVGPATRLPKALAVIKTESFDTALLDVNLDDATSWDVAAALKAPGIPFVLSLGYDITALLPDFLRGSECVRKPFRLDDLQRMILQLL